MTPSATKSPRSLPQRLLQHLLLFWLSALWFTFSLFLLVSLIPVIGSIAGVLALVENQNDLLLGTAIASATSAVGMEIARKVSRRITWIVFAGGIAFGVAGVSCAHLLLVSGPNDYPYLPFWAVVGAVLGAVVATGDWLAERLAARRSDRARNDLR